MFGYFPNASKTWLITKDEHLNHAKSLFPDVNITTEGHKYLGSFIGNQEGKINSYRSKSRIGPKTSRHSLELLDQSPN